jgi:hypothetical protein
MEQEPKVERADEIRTLKALGVTLAPADAEHDTAYRRYLLTLPRGPEERKQRPLTEHTARWSSDMSDPTGTKGKGIQKPLPILFTLTSESAHQLLISLEKGMLLPVSSTADIGFKIMALVKTMAEKP